MNAVSGYQDRAAAFGVFVGHVQGRQLRNHGTAVLVGQIGVQNAPLRLASHDQANYTDGYQ